MRIALVEDDADDAAQIMRPLQASGHICRVFSSGSQFLKSIPVDTFDAVILARDLPDMSGLDVLDAVRPRNQALPIMVVFCRGAEDDAVHALERGADDFLFKPTRHPELLARLEALMWRKTKNLSAGRITAEPYAFHLTTRQAAMYGEDIELAPRLFHLATLFFGKPGILLSRRYLLETVWGPESGIKARTLDFHVSQLRVALKLKHNNWRISSVYAHGYRLEPMPQGSVSIEPKKVTARVNPLRASGHLQ